MVISSFSLIVKNETILIDIDDEIQKLLDKRQEMHQNIIQTRNKIKIHLSLVQYRRKTFLEYFWFRLYKKKNKFDMLRPQMKALFINREEKQKFIIRYGLLVDEIERLCEQIHQIEYQMLVHQYSKLF